MFKHVLVPIDGSEPSDAAIDLALQLMKDSSGRATFAHCVDVIKIATTMGATTVGIEYGIDAERNAGQQMLNEAKARADRAGVKADSYLVEGEPASTMLDLAKQLGCNAIVIGSHGRSGFSRVFLGSIAEGIARRASIPVLLCHAASHAAAQDLPDHAKSKSLAPAGGLS